MSAAALAVAGCGGGGERENPDAAIDAAFGMAIRVASDGNDGNDGVEQPVATLQRAIAIANLHHEVTTIELAAGTYQLTDLPVRVPGNVRTVMGPAGGGAVLVGKGLDGLVAGFEIRRGRVQDLEFDNFSVAISALVTDPMETLTLANIRVVNSLVAVNGGFPTEGQSRLGKLQIDNLDISRSDIPLTRCTVGISLQYRGEVAINNVAMHNIGLAIEAPFGATTPAPTITVTGARISAAGDVSVCNTAAMEIGNSAFTLSDSTFEGGVFGMNSYGDSTVTIKDSTIRNQGAGFLGAGTFQLTNTTLSNIGSPVLASHGTWSLDGVTVTGGGRGLDFQGGGTPPLSVKLRRSTISGSRGDGINIAGAVAVDLGTAADPGNNKITGHTGVGLKVSGGTGPNPAQPTVTAAGNTWNPQIQDADAQGQYILVETLTGPIAASPGNNFAVAAGSSLRR